MGAALYSRWPITDVREAGPAVTGRVDSPWSAVVAAEIAAPFGPLLVVHHKPTWQSGYAVERERQAVACARFVEELVAGRDLHVVLAGDFDDPPDAASIRFWTGKQEVTGCRRCFDEPVGGVWPSDHFGVVADLAVPAHPPGRWA